jgi:hypothetical protein
MVKCGVLFEVRTELGIISLKSVNQLISVMVKCCVLCEVRTEFLNNYTSVGFKGLNATKRGRVSDCGYSSSYF